MKKQFKRDDIPTALKDGALKIMDTWCRGELTGAAKAVEEHRAVLNRMEDMIKQDLWNIASAPAEPQA